MQYIIYKFLTDIVIVFFTDLKVLVIGLRHIFTDYGLFCISKILQHLYLVLVFSE